MGADKSLQRFGTQRTFELGTICTAAACIICKPPRDEKMSLPSGFALFSGCQAISLVAGSQAWRASGVIGRPTLASTLIYAVGTLLHTDQAMTQSLRTIVVKQAIVSCPGSGKGEIAAAFR